MSNRDGPRPYRPTIIRYLDAQGRQVPKDTPGRRRVKMRSKTWYVDVIVNGERKHVSLKTRDKSVAEVRWHAMMREQRERDLGLRTDLTDHLARPLTEHLDTWEAHIAAGGSGAEHALRCRRDVAVLARLAAWSRLPDLSAESCQRSLAALVNDLGKSARTRNHHLSHARQFCRWCVENDRMASNPLARLRPVPVETDLRHPRRCPSGEEVGKLFVHLYGPHVLNDARRGGRLKKVQRGYCRMRNGMDGPARSQGYRVAMGTGLRAGEVRSLSRDSFELDAEPPTVTVEAAYSKHRRRDVLPLPGWLADELRSWFASGGGCWEQLPAQHPGDALRRDLEDAGVEYQTSEGFCDYHSLRIYYITALASQPGIDPKTLMELARHSDPKLTLVIYSKARPERMKIAVDQIPNPDG